MHVLLFFLSVEGLETSIDFIICLGGDGTLLYAASLFQVCITVRVSLMNISYHNSFSISSDDSFLFPAKLSPSGCISRWITRILNMF